jgi:hypothetical protein
MIKFNKNITLKDEIEKKKKQKKITQTCKLE